ncbi:MAG: GIY-YIG nuclease family protein [Minisyncoccia bacterium]
MELADLKKIPIPDVPGVYFFKKGKKILYVGKATSLRSRVKSYFSSDIIDTRGERIVVMVQNAQLVAFEETDSVLEALILEAQYIKQYQPAYNVREKDNKSYNYVVITDEEFPRIIIVRGRILFAPGYPEKILETFGPYTEGKSLREALKIIRKIFPYRDSCTPRSGKPCFNAQIHLCPGVCSGICSSDEYAAQVKHIREFLRGKKKSLIVTLTQSMKLSAKNEHFEHARELQRQIIALTHIRDVSLLHSDTHVYSDGGYFRVESYDISHLSGSQVVGAMVVFLDGIPDKSSYRKFILKNQKNDDLGNIYEVLTRRLRHGEWPLPKIILVDGAEGQRSTAEKAVKEAGKNIEVYSVVKDASHKGVDVISTKPLTSKFKAELIAINAETHRFVIAFHRKKRSQALLPR